MVSRTNRAVSSLLLVSADGASAVLVLVATQKHLMLTPPRMMLVVGVTVVGREEVEVLGETEDS